MSERAFRISEAFLSVFGMYFKNPALKRSQMGPKSLAAALRAVVDECDTMSLKTSEEIYQIAQELEDFADEI